MAEHGPDWAEDRGRLLGRLRERFPDRPRDVNLLVVAQDCGVPGRLGARTGAVSPAEAASEARRMVELYATDAVAARGAVETWAASLGRAVTGAPPASLPVEPASVAPTIPIVPPPLRSGVILPLPGVLGPPGGPTISQPVLPLPGTSVRAPRPRTAWRFAVPLGAILIAGGLWAAGPLRDRWRGPAPAPPASEDRTQEGELIATLDGSRRFRGRRIDGNPNTLLVTFGLRFGPDAFTYRATVGFEGRAPDGSGLIKAVSGGREASTGQIRVVRSMQSNGYAGFTLAAPWQSRPSFAAPPICVSALAGKSDGALDLAEGGGTFCAFATNAAGLCDGDVRLGCGELAP